MLIYFKPTFYYNFRKTQTGMKKLNALFLLLLFGMTSSIWSQQNDFVANDLKISKYVEGTLLAPRSGSTPLAIIINGSGATDRNGNQMMVNNNSSKKLAKRLAAEGIATFRYDKRTLKAKKLNIEEKDMRFEDFITDAEAVINYFAPLPNFSKIYLIGHSQGALVAMAAANKEVDGFVSIAGAGQPIDQVIIEQIGRQMPKLKEDTKTAFKELEKRGKVKEFNPALSSIFRKSAQPFMASWIKYDPQEEIQKLTIPILLINGNNDLQVNPEEAQKLKNAQPNAELVIIENMNHIFRIVDKNDDIANQKSYNEPQRPISDKLVEVISNFILN